MESGWGGEREREGEIYTDRIRDKVTHIDR